MREVSLSFSVRLHEEDYEVEMHIGVDVIGEENFVGIPILKIVLTKNSLKEVKVLHEEVDENTAFEIVKMVKPKAIEFLKKLNTEIRELSGAFENADISEPVKRAIAKIAEDEEDEIPF